MKTDLRAELNIQGLLLMYVGNLEAYQGIDLLLESFAIASAQAQNIDLVIIGGTSSDIQKYSKKAVGLNIHHRTHFLGPKPIEHLNFYLSQADILVSPRIKGKNTPMKLYSYLDSGKALLATNLSTHTQVLNAKIALLAEPESASFSAGMLKLIEDKNLRLKLASAGKQLIEQKHTYEAFRHNLWGLYDSLQADLGSTREPLTA